MTRGLAFDTSDKQRFLLLWVNHTGFKLALNESNKYRISFNLLCVHYISCLLNHNTPLERKFFVNSLDTVLSFRQRLFLFFPTSPVPFSFFLVETNSNFENHSI